MKPITLYIVRMFTPERECIPGEVGISLILENSRINKDLASLKINGNVMRHRPETNLKFVKAKQRKTCNKNREGKAFHYS